MSLDSVMEFDCPVTVNADGTVTDGPAGVYAPEVLHSREHGMLIDGKPFKDAEQWEAFSVGYTGQDRYHGPVMHESEYIGGGLERDILATPGVYVVCVVEVLSGESDDPEENEDPDDDPEPAGWTVLRRKD